MKNENEESAFSVRYNPLTEKIFISRVVEGARYEVRFDREVNSIFQDELSGDESAKNYSISLEGEDIGELPVLISIHSHPTFKDIREDLRYYIRYPSKGDLRSLLLTFEMNKTVQCIADEYYSQRFSKLAQNYPSFRYILPPIEMIVTLDKLTFCQLPKSFVEKDFTIDDDTINSIAWKINIFSMKIMENRKAIMNALKKVRFSAYLELSKKEPDEEQMNISSSFIESREIQSLDDEDMW
ncbi:MAG: hypothetical protein NZ903_00835 [Candidatus Micrarchaeota archaeon]|nr:hypothetical protein [Candidatus Micrarchaeota archaeon]